MHLISLMMKTLVLLTPTLLPSPSLPYIYPLPRHLRPETCGCPKKKTDKNFYKNKQKLSMASINAAIEQILPGLNMQHVLKDIRIMLTKHFIFFKTLLLFIINILSFNSNLTSFIKN